MAIAGMLDPESSLPYIIAWSQFTGKLFAKPSKNSRALVYLFSFLNYSDLE